MIKSFGVSLFVVISLLLVIQTAVAEPCKNIKCYLNVNNTHGTLNCSKDYVASRWASSHRNLLCSMNFITNKIILNTEKKERLYAHNISDGAMQRLFKSQGFTHSKYKLSISYIYIQNIASQDFEGLNLDYLSLWNPKTISSQSLLQSAVNRNKFDLRLFCESQNPDVTFSQLHFPAQSWRVKFEMCKKVKYSCYKHVCKDQLQKYILKLQNHDDAVKSDNTGSYTILSDQCHEVEYCAPIRSQNRTQNLKHSTNIFQATSTATVKPNGSTVKSFNNKSNISGSSSNSNGTLVLAKSNASLTMTLVILTVLNILLLTIVFAIIICLCVRHRRYRHHTFYIESSTNSKVQLIDKTPIVPRRSDTIESYSN